MHRIAFYDLDRTVTRLPTWSAFLLFGALSGPRWRLALVPGVAGAALAHALRLVGRDRLKEVMHRLMLGETVAAEQLAALAERFADRTLDRNIRPGARRRIAADRAEGYRVVLATAAHRFYAEELAQRLSIADVIATESTLDADGAVRHRLAGANVYGPAKLAAIKAWMIAAGIDRDMARLRFYSDHASDAPCLLFVDEPFAVNPGRRMRTLAAARGWPILDWQRPVAPVNG